MALLLRLREWEEAAGIRRAADEAKRIVSRMVPT